MAAYAQSKLAITMWSRTMAQAHQDGPCHYCSLIPVLYWPARWSKRALVLPAMILALERKYSWRAALSDEIRQGIRSITSITIHNNLLHPHSDALNREKSKEVVMAIETILAKLTATTNK